MADEEVEAEVEGGLDSGGQGEGSGDFALIRGCVTVLTVTNCNSNWNCDAMRHAHSFHKKYQNPVPIPSDEWNHGSADCDAYRIGWLWNGDGWLTRSLAKTLLRSSAAK